MKIQEKLERLGLNPKEIKVYLAMLKSDSILPSEIVKKTKLKRPTVYVIIDSLISKGLVAKDTTAQPLRVIPLSPSNLVKSIREEEKFLKEKRDMLSEVVSEIENIRSEKEYPVPKMTFIEKEKVDDYLYDNTGKWFASCDEDKTCYGFQSLIRH